MNPIIEFSLRPLSSGLFLWVFPLFVCLQIADAATTLKVLKQGGQELNPVMRWLFERLGPAQAFALVKAGVCLAVYLYLRCNVLVGLCGLYVWVVAHNIGQLRRGSQ